MVPPLSIVVPVYNVESCLAQCLDSLVRQRLTDLEILVINDGSTDGSGEILSRYASRYPQLRLIEQENRGYSGARNRGLSEATGRYIGFVDADDFVDAEMFSVLFGLAESERADIAQCSFYWYMQDSGRLQRRDGSWAAELLRRSHGRREGAEAVLLDEIAIWKRIYRRELLDGLRFDEQMAMGEDVPFALQSYCLSRKTVACNRPLYYYRKHRPGQQTAITDRRLFAFFQIFATMERFMVEHDLEYLRPWMLHLELSRHCYGYEMAAPEIRDEYFRKLVETFRQKNYRATTPIAPGPWRHGSISNRLRFLGLLLTHPRALRAIVGDDQRAFERVIRYRKMLQGVGGKTSANPGG